jgi:hypothetical protein
MARKREPEKAEAPDTVGKRVTFDLETWQALDLLARGRMMPFQELADEAFRDVLKKHGRPYDNRDAFKRSARLAQANDDNPSNGKKKPPKSKRPTGGRRARS